MYGLEREAALGGMPADVRDLLDEIEDFAGVRVGFKLSDLDVPENWLSTAALDVNPVQAIILLDSIENISASEIAHELLHLKRLWVEQVPTITAENRANQNLCDGIDNVLEHMVVVPRQTEMGFDASDYWAKVARLNWSNYPHDFGDNPKTRRRETLKHWLTLELSGDPEAKRMAIECSQKEGILKDCENFVPRVKALLHSKPRVVSAAFRFFQLSTRDAHLTVYDIRNREAIPSSIPPH